MPTEKYAHAPGDPRALPAHREAVRPLRQRAVPHRGHRPGVGRRPLALDHPHQPRRRLHRPVPRHGHRAAARAQAARHPRHRGLPGPLVPHQPLGLRLHRRRPERRADGASWPTSGSPSSAPAPPRCSACRTWPRPARSSTSSSARRRRSTCATTGRPIPSGSPRSPRRAGSSAGWRTSPPTRPAACVEEDLVHGRLDRPRPPRAQQDHGAAAGGVHAARG